MCNGKPQTSSSASCYFFFLSEVWKYPDFDVKDGFYYNSYIQIPRLWPGISRDHRHLGSWNFLCTVMIHASWDSQSLSTIGVDLPKTNCAFPKQTVQHLVGPTEPLKSLKFKLFQESVVAGKTDRSSFVKKVIGIVFYVVSRAESATMCYPIQGRETL